MKKSADAFRTISEVADWLDTPTHVLRFWESKFTQIKPVKRAGGRRYYRPKDMLLIGGIKKLLHKDGLTIKGAKKVLSDHGQKHVCSLSKPLISSRAEESELDKIQMTKGVALGSKSKAEWQPVGIEAIATNLNTPSNKKAPNLKVETSSNVNRTSSTFEDDAIMLEEKNASNNEKVDFKKQAKKAFQKKVTYKTKFSADQKQATLNFWDEDDAEVSKKAQYLPKDKKPKAEEVDTPDLGHERQKPPNVKVTANQASILDHLTRVRKLRVTQARLLVPLLSKLEKTIHQRQRSSKR